MPPPSGDPCPMTDAQNALSTPAPGDESAPANQSTRPSRRWMKRLAWAFALLFLTLAVLRWAWGCEAERRLQAKIAEYRAAGQPVLFEDFAREPIPDNVNAALLLMRAAGLAQPARSAATQVSGVTARPMVDTGDLAKYAATSPEHRDLLTALITDNQPALNLVHDAARLTQADWGTRLKSPAITVMFPNLSSQRALAKLEWAAAAHEHLRGDDAAALAHLRDLLAVGHHIAQETPSLITHFVHIAIGQVLVSAIESMAHELSISEDAPNGADLPRPASRADVQALLRALLDERELREDCCQAFYAERIYQLDTVQCLVDGRLTLSGVNGGPLAGPRSWAERTLALLIGPAWKLDAIHMMECSTAAAAAGSAPNWATAQALLPPEPQPPSGFDKLPQMMSSILLPSLGRAVELHFQALAKRRMAVLALAIRLYEIDHGRRPTTLDELVPDYLSAVPRDPFDGADGPIRYLPDAPSPLLYSVASNGSDDGGAFALAPLPQGGVAERTSPDLPFFLNGDRPLPPPPPPPAPASASAAPSTQAADDHPNIEDGERDQHQQEPEAGADQPE